MKNESNTNIIGRASRLGDAIAYIKGKRLAKTQKEIASAINVDEGNLSKAIKGSDKYLTEGFLQRLAEEYNLNYDWLLTGEGEMRQETNIKVGSVNNSGGNAVVGNTGVVEVKSSSNMVDAKEVISYETGVPYYNVDFINGFSSVEEIFHQNPDYKINYPPANHCNIWVNATGDSMKGLIDNGDKIALKLVDKEWFPLGEVYAIVTTNGHRMVKRITRSENADCYKLVSANPDKNEYPDQDIPKRLILSLFKVVTAIKLIN